MKSLRIKIIETRLEHFYKYKKDIGRGKSNITAAMDELKIFLENIIHYKLKKIFLFGSSVRSDYESDSDVDILILADLTETELEELNKSNKHNNRFSQSSVITSLTLMSSNILFIISSESSALNSLWYDFLNPNSVNT